MAPLHRATMLVAENEYELRARGGAGELHAAQYVGVDDIAGHTGHKKIPDAAVEDVFDRNARVQA